jgi:hypothetical protein
MDLRKFHYNILCRSEMGAIGAEVLAGRAKSISAKHYLIHELPGTDQTTRIGTDDGRR